MQRQRSKVSSRLPSGLRFHDRKVIEQEPKQPDGSSILFVIDIDENLAKIQIATDSISHITASAASYVSNSAPGTILLPELMAGKFGVIAQAFRRQVWKAFFEQTAAINEQYANVRFGKMGKLVNIIFLTNASYEAKCFMEIFDQFFDEDLEDLEDLRARLFSDTAKSSDEVFCAQFYNCVSQRKLFAEKGFKTEGPNKGLFLDLKFEDFKREFGVERREDLTLVDDNQTNVTGVIDKGFSAIHHPASVFKEPDVRFEEKKDEVFKEMYARIQDAQVRFAQQKKAAPMQKPGQR